MTIELWLIALQKPVQYLRRKTANGKISNFFIKSFMGIFSFKIYHYFDNRKELILNVLNIWFSGSLKKRCFELINYADPMQIYKSWKLWRDQMSTINPEFKFVKEEVKNLDGLLCRGDSATLRDCKNFRHTERQNLKLSKNEILKEKIFSLL